MSYGIRAQVATTSLNMRPTSVAVALVGVFLFAIAAIFLIWLPIGTAMTALVEEWGILGVFVQTGKPNFLALKGALFEGQRIRPLTIAPIAVAYELSPNSFYGWHLLQGFALVLKVFSVAAIVRWLCRSWALSAIAGVLFAVYPADTMQMTFRSFHINWAIALTLSGIAMFMWSIQTVGWKRISASLLSSVLFVTGVFIYEGGILLAPLPLLLWWARYGLKNPIRGNVIPIIFWAAACALICANVLINGNSQDTYQASVTGGVNKIPREILSNLPLLFKIGFYRAFAHGWFDGWRMLISNISLVLPYAITVAALCGCALLAMSREDVAVTSAARLISAGIVSFVLGYLPYMGFGMVVLTTQRTFLFAAFGATLVTIALFEQLWVQSKPAAGVIIMALILAGFGNQWEQLRLYTELSLRQREVLSGILEATQGRSRLLVIDQTGQLKNSWFLDTNLSGALSFLTNTPVDADVCQVSCQMTSDQTAVTVAFDRPVIADPPSEPSDYQQRWRDFLGCSSAAACKYSPNPSDRFSYDFGTYWSMETVAPGTGWRSQEWTAPSFNPKSFSFMTASEAKLVFPLTPRKAKYFFQMDLMGNVDPKTLSETTIIYNDRSLRLNWTSPTSAQADIPGDLLKEGLNFLTIIAPINPMDGLGLQVDNIKIEPR